MVPILQILLWLALPLGVAVVTRNRAVPTVPAMAATMALLLAALALWDSANPPVVLSQAAVDGTYHDTYYIISHARSYWALCLGYTCVAGLTALIQYLTRPGPPPLPLIAFWLFHIGSPISVFPTALLAGFPSQPRRYADYPASFALWNQIAIWGTMLVWLAEALLLVALLMALFRAARRSVGR